ncbi:MAG: hypothetical protein CMJ18_18275 [Phycisphaeraceae bacterium]|nr:hypothetical protein [Phycisphaeraceae bacterium]
MKVLVSIESVEEAASIVEAGVDILDVKNVAEGALGAQAPWRTAGIVDLARPHGVRTSAALGDLDFKPGTAALAARGAASLGVDYVKAGLHSMSTAAHACDMMAAVGRAARMDDGRASVVASVVACGYADWRRFDGLSAGDLVHAAHATQCDAVMVDTAIKDGTSLFDHMSRAEIADFVGAARAAQLVVALAGSINLEHVVALQRIDPDFIGVRGAVCRNDGDRTTTIDPEKTACFCATIHESTAARTARTSSQP